MKQQALPLALDIQLFRCQPRFGFAPAAVRGFDLRFDRLTFPTACHTMIITFLAAGARFLACQHGLIAAKGELRASGALIAFKAPDPLPVMRPRQYAAAQGERFTAGLIHHTKVVFYPAGDQLHVCHTLAHRYHQVHSRSIA